jgi:hypothetical protein
MGPALPKAIRRDLWSSNLVNAYVPFHCLSVFAYARVKICPIE